MTRQETPRDFLIIGDGLVAKYLLRRIFEVNPAAQCQQVAHDEFAPSCTYNTTAVLTRNGIEKGVSSLGDNLVDALDFTLKFFQKNNAAGIEHVTQTFLVQGDKETSQLKRRFGIEQQIEMENGWSSFNYHATLICPEVFLSWLEKDYKQNTNYHFNKDFIVSLKFENDTWFAKSQNGNQYLANNVFICTGAYGKFLNLNSNHDETLKYSKPVSGSYLTTQWEGPEHGFVYSFKGFNLIYRHQDKTLMIGGDTDTNFIIAPHYNNMHKFYDLVISQLAAKYDLPDFESFEIKTGLRHKGQRRKPFWGKVDENLYAIHSLYKNGYTLAFLAVEDVLASSGILNS